jgi:lysophospholipase L1-like esterase
MPDGERQVSPEAYERNLRQLVLQLKGTGAKVIWATTTPVPEGAAGRHGADAPLYNGIANKIMDENRVVIDDLYTFALPQLTKIQQPKNVHFSTEGSEALAKRVAASIEAVLAQKK